MEAYDPGADTWKTLAPLPATRRDLALAAAGGRLYAIGGSAVVGGQCCAGVATVEEFDPASGSWAARAPLAVVPEALAAVSYGRLYVLGASAASTVLTLQQATITG